MSRYKEVRYIARNDERGWHVWDRELQDIAGMGIPNYTRAEAIIRAEAFEQARRTPKSPAPSAEVK